MSSEEAGSVSVCGREMGGWDGGCECVGVRVHVFVYIKCTQTRAFVSVRSCVRCECGCKRTSIHLGMGVVCT